MLAYMFCVNTTRGAGPTDLQVPQIGWDCVSPVLMLRLVEVRTILQVIPFCGKIVVAD